MLVLTRRLDEKLLISQDGRLLAEITVCRCSPHQVRLGVEAPPDVDVVRAELVESAGAGIQGSGVGEENAEVAR